MKLTVLIENTTREEALISEHGLSIYIETTGHRLLMDTGASSALMENARTLGIDLTGVDTVILSHGHYDHGGGLLAFASQNDTADIYLRESALEKHCRPTMAGMKDIGLDERIKALSGLIPVNGNVKLDDEIFLFGNVTERVLWPDGNRVLMKEANGKAIQDNFEHEQYVILSEGGKEVLLSGCAHNGIVNILEEAVRLRGREPDIVISGFHTRKKQGYTRQDVHTIRQIGQKLSRYRSRFYTGHCTGEEPFRILREVMGSQIQQVYTGWQMEI